MECYSVRFLTVWTGVLSFMHTIMPVCVSAQVKVNFNYRTLCTMSRVEMKVKQYEGGGGRGEGSRQMFPFSINRDQGF